GEYDFVALADELAAKAVRDEVDAVGGAAGIDDLALFACIDEALDPAARFLVFGRGLFREIVNRAVNIRVLGRLIPHDPVDHGLRHLAGGRVVEEDERLPVYLEIEDREIGA